MPKKTTANLHIRLPSSLKKEAERVIAALGLDASSAIRLFYTQVALQQTIPFPLPTLRPASAKTHKIVLDAVASGTIGPFADAKTALKALYAAA